MKRLRLGGVFRLREGLLGSNGLRVADKSTDELLDLFRHGEGNGRAVAGNGQCDAQCAFEEIVRRYAGMVYTVCLQVTRDAHDAEDATQAAFLTLAVRAKTAENIKYLGPWMQKVARRLSLDIMRAKKRRKRREEVRGDIVRRMQPNRDPHHRLDRAEMSEIVRDELQKLPSKYRLPLILHYFGGMRPEQVARELGYKPSTLGVRLHRGRKMLADSLAGRGIKIPNALLATVLGGILHQGVSDNVIAQNALLAAGLSVDGQLPGAIISARVMSLARHAAAAVVWAKAKAAVASVLLASAALAGGVQVVRAIAPFEFELRLLNPWNWIKPLLRSLPPAPQFGAAAASLIPHTQASAILAAQPDAITPTLGSHKPASAHGVAEAAMDDAAATWFESRLTLSAPIDSPGAPGVSDGSASMSLALAGRLEDFDWCKLPAPAAAPWYPHDGGDVPGFVLDRNSGLIFHHAGTRRFDRLVLDSVSAQFNIYAMTGSARLLAHSLVVGDVSRGTFMQTSGQVHVSGEVILGRRPGSHGSYHLAGNSRLVAATQYVGFAGVGHFKQTGGSNSAQRIHIGHERGSQGTYTLDGGSLRSSELSVGVSGSGQFEQSGGENVVNQSPSGAGVVTLGANEHGAGNYLMSGGTLRADALHIGHAGTGTFMQTGGTTMARDIELGLSSSGQGTLVLGEGTLRIAPAGQIVVGSRGAGTLILGNVGESATICEEASDSAVPLTVRAHPAASGTFRGNGTVRLRGRLEQNGRVISDGFGKSRELNLSSVSDVTNTIDNPIGEVNGWYARNGGKLVLPPLEVPFDRIITWGEDPHDPVPDLVNSVRITARDVSQPGKAIISLVAPDYKLLPRLPTEEWFIGLWSLDLRELEFGHGNILLRYDDRLIEQLGGDEQSLRMWTYDQQWQQVPRDWLLLDSDLNLMSGYVSGELRFFGLSLPRQSIIFRPILPPVSVPEPLGAAMVSFAAGALLLRSRGFGARAAAPGRQGYSRS